MSSTDLIATPEEQPVISPPRSPRFPLVLKLMEYLALAGFIVLGILVLLLEWNHSLTSSLAQALLLSSGIVFGVALIFILINRQLSVRIAQLQQDAYLQERAEIWSTTLVNTLKPTILAARQKALRYSQELIDDYKKTRSICRNLYCILQMTTILFSGVTPILVLVDKLQTADSWARWLPVIFPAIASIVASIVTSFPFQENWIAANATVELLEAEQEKFILGVTQNYRPPLDISDPKEQLQCASQAIENYINQVNSIHLKRVQESSNAEKNQNQQTQQTQGAGVTPKAQD